MREKVLETNIEYERKIFYYCKKGPTGKLELWKAEMNRKGRPRKNANA